MENEQVKAKLAEAGRRADAAIEHLEAADERGDELAVNDPVVVGAVTAFREAFEALEDAG